MNCPNCGQANEAGRKFCAECGTALVSPCPTCGTVNAPGVKFCGECGNALTADARRAAEAPPAAYPPAPAAAQRRQVTILFVDLVGFTEFAEGRDSEDVRDVQSGYFGLARETIERYGGTVEKFIGDAVMALWGAPVAYEDDAERAVRAALDVVGSVETVDPSLIARAAVVTGEATVSLDAAGEGMASGDAVNTASRLQSVAAPGTVLVSEATRIATRQAIVFERADDQQLKGKALPTAAWRALRVVAGRRGAGRSEQLEAPFVGREAELRHLKDLLNTTATVRRTRVVSIIGQAGVGKSRLVWELEKYVDGIVEDVYWHYGRSPSHGDGVTFWALGEMVRQRSRIAEHDDADTSRAHLAETVADIIPDPIERAWVEPRLQALLGIAETSPSGDQEELFAAWRRFFERIAERGTTVLVFEDLQWADAGLVDFVTSLVEWSRRSPLLIVTLARPELFARHAGWGAGQLNFVSIHLEPLSEPEMTELLTGLAPGLPADAVRAIVERAEGIPLYAVETVRMLIDSGSVVRDEETGTYRVVGEIVRPRVAESLHALVAARLDALPPVERELVQDASVIGQAFSVRSLLAFAERDTADTERMLHGLVRRELLTRVDDPTSPERGQFVFVQSVVREVAYETMSRATRRAKHAAAARDLEATGDEELAPLLASHYYRAHQLASGAEADALAAQARVALRAAAERAAALHSHDQAITFYEQALALTPDPVEQAPLLERAGAVAESAARPDAAERYYQRAIDVYEGVGDRRAATRTYVRLGGVRMFAGRPAEIVDRLESLLAAAEADPDDASAAQLAAQTGRAQMALGRSDQAVATLDRALAYAARADDIATTVEALISKGAVLGNVGRRREGIAVLAGAIELTSMYALTQPRLRAMYNLAGALFADDPRRANQIQRDGLTLARDLGQRQWMLSLGALAINADLSEGQWDAALELAAELEASSVPDLERANINSTVAMVRAYRGDDGGAAELMADAWRRLEGVTKFDDVGWMHLIQSEVNYGAGRYREAVASLMESTRYEYFASANLPLVLGYALLLRDTELLDETVARVAETPKPNGRFLDSWVARGDAAVAAMRGNVQEAMVLFRHATEELRDMGQVVDLVFTHLLIISALGNESPLGQAAEREAREILVPLRARALLDRLDDAVRAGPLSVSAPAAKASVGQVVEPVLERVDAVGERL